MGRINRLAAASALWALAAGCVTQNEFDPGPPPPEIPDDYHRGVDRYQRGMYEEAIDDLTAAIKKRPDWSRSFFWRANAFMKIVDSPQARWTEQQYLEAAIIDYSRAIELKPADADSWYHRALAYIQVRKYDLAARDLLQLTTSVSPTDPDPEKILGFLYDEKFDGMEQQAMEHYVAYYRKGGRDQEVVNRLRGMEPGIGVAPPAEPAPERERKAKEIFGEFAEATLSGDKPAQARALETLMKDYADTKFVSSKLQQLRLLLEDVRKP